MRAGVPNTGNISAPGMGQCSEMSPEGAKGYVTVTVRCGREAFVACFPQAQRS
jgi:hypothetical protein